MPSGRRRSQPDPTKPVFLLDRGLGVNLVANAIRSRGYQVLPMVEVYPQGRDQFVPDNDWIQRASAENWIALTKDYSMFRDPASGR